MTAGEGATPKDHDGWMWDLTIRDDHDFYVLPAGGSDDTTYIVDQHGVTPVLAHNCDPTLPGHADACGCDNGRGPILGVSPSAGDLVVLGRAEVGEPLAQAEGGMTFNGERYQYAHDGGDVPQWVSEVGSAIENPDINLAVDLGGLSGDMPGANPMDIFQAAAERGKVGWRNGGGMDWEMRQIQRASYSDPGLAGRISWYLNGRNVTSQMTGSLLPPGAG